MVCLSAISFVAPAPPEPEPEPPHPHPHPHPHPYPHPVGLSYLKSNRQIPVFLISFPPFYLKNLNLNKQTNKLHQPLLSPVFSETHNERNLTVVLSFFLLLPTLSFLCSLGGSGRRGCPVFFLFMDKVGWAVGGVDRRNATFALNKASIENCM